MSGARGGPDEARTRTRLGAALVLGAGLMFALAGVCIKQASAELDVALIVFWRNLFSAALLLPWVLWHGPTSLATPNAGLIALRALAVLAALYCYAYAIGAIPLADAVLLNFSSPVFVPLLGFLVFGFRLDRTALIAVLTGFAGIALVLDAGAGVIRPAALVGLAGGVLGALAVVFLWRMPGSERPARIAFLFALIGLLVSAGPAAWQWRMPLGEEWLALAAFGLFSTAAHLLLAHGCLIAPVDRVSTFDYSAVVFAAAFGWLLWDERLAPAMLVGAALVVLAGVVATRRVAPRAALPEGVRG